MARKKMVKTSDLPKPLINPTPVKKANGIFLSTANFNQIKSEALEQQLIDQDVAAALAVLGKKGDPGEKQPSEIDSKGQTQAAEGPSIPESEVKPETCKAVKVDGSPCSLKASFNGYCHIHKDQGV